MPRRREYKPIVKTLDMCVQATELLKAAGFVHANTARMQASYSAYYRWPGRRGLIRVSDHKADRGLVKRLGLGEPVLVKLTFAGDLFTRAGTMRLGPDALRHKVAAAIGNYLLTATADSVSETAA